MHARESAREAALAHSQQVTLASVRSQWIRAQAAISMTHDQTFCKVCHLYSYVRFSLQRHAHGTNTERRRLCLHDATLIGCKTHSSPASKVAVGSQAIHESNAPSRFRVMACFLMVATGALACDDHRICAPITSGPTTKGSLPMRTLCIKRGSSSIQLAPGRKRAMSTVA
jgi:hypothetical protein